VPRVELLNDLQAAAYGMLWLAPAELATLQTGSPSASGNLAVIAPGTGLGEAMLLRDGERMLPVASEGGHGDFAPGTEGEIELLRFLRHEVGEHVSYERILSGDGFHRLYRFLRDSGHAPEPAWLRERLTRGDPNAAITEIGLAGEHPLCVGALELFCSILGAEAGNLALRSVATAGIYIGGGIAPKILTALQRGSLLGRFAAKGRFSEWMARIPVRVALNPQAALIGAAHYGVRRP
jgi:glucokinase